MARTASSIWLSSSSINIRSRPIARQRFDGITIELGPIAIRLIAGIIKPGIGPEPAHQFGDYLVVLDRLRQSCAISCDFGELALVILLQRLRQRLTPSYVSYDLWRIRAGIKITQVPLGHVAQRRRGAAGRISRLVREGKQRGGLDRRHALLQNR